MNATPAYHARISPRHENGGSLVHHHGLRWTTITLGLALIWPQSAAGTDGIEPIGISMQSLARGGADVAVGDSALSQIDNPATLTLSPDDAVGLDFAGQLLMPRTRWDGRIDSAPSTIRHIPLGHVGLALPQNERLTLGVAFHSKSQLGTRFRLRHLVMRDLKRRFGSDMRDFALSLNVGYRSTRKLSLGAGVRGELATAEFNTVSGPLTLDFGRGYAVGGGFQLGLHYQALPTLAFGLGYRSPTWFQDLTGRDSEANFAGESEAGTFGRFPIPLGKGTVRNIRLPQRVAAGLAWDATDWLKIVGEARWLNYAGSTFDTTRLRFLIPISPVGILAKTPIGYRDQWVFITGTEFKLSRHWKLGVGYHYATDPIANSTVLPIAANVTQHHLTAGLRYEADKWWIGGGYVLGLENAVRANWRTNTPFGTDYRRGRLEQTQHSVMLGFGFHW